MVHDRPYSHAIGHAAAIEELRRCADLQFDPELVELFCSIYAASPPQADMSLLIVPPDISASRALGHRSHRAISA
jgi:hypothetical protein